MGLLCVNPLNQDSDQLDSLQDACQLRSKEKICCRAKVEEEELHILKQHSPLFIEQIENFANHLSMYDILNHLKIDRWMGAMMFGCVKEREWTKQCAGLFKNGTWWRSVSN